VVPTLAVLIVVAVAVAALDAHNGVPVALLLFILAIIVLSYVGSHTRFGIYLYAAGSNPSAVVRAGIKVDRIRIAAFMICGGFAAFGGISGRFPPSRRLGAIVGMGTLLLEAITAAVVEARAFSAGEARLGRPCSAPLRSPASPTESTSWASACSRPCTGWSTWCATSTG